METIRKLLEWGTDGTARNFKVGNVDVALKRDVGWDDGTYDQYHHITTKVKSFKNVSFANPGLTGSVKQNMRSGQWEAVLNAQGFTADTPDTPILLDGRGVGKSAEEAIQLAIRNFIQTSTNSLAN